MQILLNTKTLEHFTLLSLKIINCHSDMKHSMNECRIRSPAMRRVILLLQNKLTIIMCLLVHRD